MSNAALHVARTWPDDAAVDQLRVVRVRFGMLDNVEVSAQKDVRRLGALRKNDERVVAVGLKLPQLNPLQLVEVIADKLEAPLPLHRARIGARNQDEVPGQRRESQTKFVQWVSHKAILAARRDLDKSEARS